MVVCRIIFTRRPSRSIAASVVVLALVASIGLTACRLPDVHSTRVLKAELPSATWESITSAFSLDPDQTDAMRNQVAQLYASVSDYKVDWWVFTYPGSVHQAASALVNPPGAEVTQPREDTVQGALETHLAWWGTEQEQSRGKAWLDKAGAQAVAWKDHPQDVAEVTFVVEEPFGPAGELLRSVTWSFVLVSPLIDLERLELVSGTFLVISRYDWLYVLEL